MVVDKKISSYVQNSTGKVLVEHATYARLNGKEIPPEASSVFELEKNKIINPSDVLRFYKNQNYSLVIYYSRFTLIDGLKDYIEKNYEFIDSIKWKSLESVDRTWLIYRKI
jgi:hypothetical protein